MYDRTPRTLGQTVGCTPAHIGPGAYHHHRQKQQQEGLESHKDIS